MKAELGLFGIALVVGGCASSVENGSVYSSGPTQYNNPTQPTPTPTQSSNTAQGSNIDFSGSQDFGFFRSEVNAGRVPPPNALDAAGFFAEHFNALPPPTCGERICLQQMLGVMGNLLNGGNCTMLELGLNSPLEANPGARPPLSLAVVVDVSGSMAGEKIQFVRDGLGLLIDGMQDIDQLALIKYSDTATTVAPLQPLSGHRVELRNASLALAAGGGTNLAAGLETGYREIQAHYDTTRQNRVILMSDGVPTSGITSTSSILDMSRTYNSDGIGLTTIGLGRDFNIDLMRGLALQADGNFYFLESAGAVNDVFTEELSYFTVPVAFDLKLNVRAGTDYQFGRALGTPFWTDTADGGTLSIPSVFIAHRQSAQDVTATNGRRGGGSELLIELMPKSAGGAAGATVADVDMTFREPGTNRIVTSAVSAPYPYPPQELQPKGYFAADNIAAVQKSFVMLNIFVGMESVVNDFAARRAGLNTMTQLDSLIAAVEDYNFEVQDTDIALDLELLRKLRQNLVANGVPDGSSPPPADPWPAD